MTAAFDWRGYSEERLLRLCDHQFIPKRPCGVAYWTSEYYSIGPFLRKFAGYPSWLPLFVYSQHGAGYDPVTYEHEIANDAEAMLVFNSESLNNYRAVSDKPCYQVAQPYISHRRSSNIIPAPDARGSLVFPCHSTMEIDVFFDVKAYIQELKKLPAAFHPLAVCLHCSDIKKNLHKIFLNHDLPVYTAGGSEDVLFGNRLYDLMRHFKYTMSNHVGSYAYYSVEMGIPFSLFGKAGRLINRADPNLPPGPIPLSSNVYVQKEVGVFSGIHTQILPAQKEFVEHVLGVNQGLSGPELRKILFEAYRKRRGRGRLFTDTFRAAGRKAKRLFKTYF